MGGRGTLLGKASLFHLLAAASTLLFVGLQFLDPSIIREHVESRTYDLRLHLRENLQQLLNIRPPRADILIVAIDEQSLKEYGRWPWDRKVTARLVDGIAKDRPRAMGIDLLFPETQDADADGKLADAIRRADNTVVAALFDVPKDGEREAKSAERSVTQSDALFDAAFMDVRTVKGIAGKSFAVKADSVAPPVAPISGAAPIAHVYSLPDRDGILRWETLALRHGTDSYPSLALQVARIAMGVPMEKMVLYAGSGVGLGDTFVPTDLHGRALINYRGPERSFPYISAADVISGRTAPGIFTGKIVLVGTSAVSTYDAKMTPFSANMPGVEKNATVVENIIANDFLRRSPGVVEVAAMLAAGLILTLSLPRMPVRGGFMLALFFVVAYGAVNVGLLAFRGIWANAVYPFLGIVSIVTAHHVLSLFREEKRAREIRAMFSSYVSPKIVAQLVEQPEKAKLGGERREVTILFSDIRGFTSFSSTRAPEDVVAMLNEYLTEMTEIVFHWDGTLDKFIGDAILAFWGAPLDQQDHAERAVRCALHMSGKMDQLRDKWRSEGKPALDIGIGINTGEVLIGNIGALGKKMDYTIIGDHVNLGSRVEGLTKTFNARIVVTEFTRDKIGTQISEGHFGHIDIELLEAVTVRGREVPVTVYRLVDKPH